MVEAADDLVYEMRNSGQLGVGGCLTSVMLIVFGGMPLMLIAMTVQDIAEAPISLPIFYLVSFLPLGILYVLWRLMKRYALRIRRDGEVELVLPFKTIRMARGELGSVKTAEVRAETPGTSPMRRTLAYFIGADGQVKANVAMAAFTGEQWQGFFAALSRARPEVTIE